MANLNAHTLWVPIEVLNSTTHSANARLTWLLLTLGSSRSSSELTDVRLRQLSGLDRKTIAAARSQLAQVPLAPCYGRPYPSCVATPVALLTTAEISVGARLLYGQLRGVPSFYNRVGSFTYETLSRLTGTSLPPLRRAVAELVAAGWLTITRANRKSPLLFTLRNPVSTQLRARRIDQKIPERMARRNLEGLAPLVAALEEMAAEHRERTAEERARTGHRGVYPAIE